MTLRTGPNRRLASRLAAMATVLGIVAMSATIAVAAIPSTGDGASSTWN